jgi:hypothetical protein
VEQLIILALSLVFATNFARPVSAGFPVVSNVIVWNDGVNTVQNVTVSHSPQTSIHYLDRVEVDLSGDNRIFPVAFRPETTFVVQCDLGIVESPTNATIRAHCIIDGYSLSLYEPILVPEFSFSLLHLLARASQRLQWFLLTRARLGTKCKQYTPLSQVSAT